MPIHTNNTIIIITTPSHRLAAVYIGVALRRHDVQQRDHSVYFLSRGRCLGQELQVNSPPSVKTVEVILVMSGYGVGDIRRFLFTGVVWNSNNKYKYTNADNNDDDDDGRDLRECFCSSLAMDGVLSSCQNFLKRPPATTTMSATIEEDLGTGGC
jgi:hypothetical protein